MSLTSAQMHKSKQHPDNPIVFFDVEMRSTPIGRIAMELFAHTVPRTAENFRQFCTGEYTRGIPPVPIGYKGCPFHRVIRDFMIQGGDFNKGDGTSSFSIYGPSFDDEDLTAKHDQPGLLSMANSGPNTNGSQFFITTVPAPWLDGKHVVFGRVLDGMKAVRMVENCSVGQANKPVIPITIRECGEL